MCCSLFFATRLLTRRCGARIRLSTFAPSLVSFSCLCFWYWAAVPARNTLTATPSPDPSDLTDYAAPETAAGLTLVELVKKRGKASFDPIITLAHTLLQQLAVGLGCSGVIIPAPHRPTASPPRLTPPSFLRLSPSCHARNHELPPDQQNNAQIVGDVDREHGPHQPLIPIPSSPFLNDHLLQDGSLHIVHLLAHYLTQVSRVLSDFSPLVSHCHPWFSARSASVAGPALQRPA